MAAAREQNPNQRIVFQFLPARKGFIDLKALFPDGLLLEYTVSRAWVIAFFIALI